MTSATAGFSRRDVARLEDTLPETSNLRAALQKLTSDQTDLVARFVDGFESRRSYLRWSQDAAVHTLGELGGEWFVERAFSRTDMSALLVGRARERWLPEDGETVEPRQAEDVRRGVAAADVLPACAAAHRRLRWSATEYVQDHDDELQPDPEVQQHPAMRPALSELDERQEWALEACLEGFEGRDALMAWGHHVVEASYAEVDGDLISRLALDEPHTRNMLVVGPKAREDPEGGRLFRESFAALYLLPAFAMAASEVAKRAGELAEQESKEITDTLL
ncbi:hypothetical protein [Halolamina sp.]|uniref:hypothetical protein n=1 Tax=Halolamina sp. TaxID=1940283 RepID=UPI003568C123